MSQLVFADINPASTSGTQLATYLNDFKDALMSGLSGTTRPSELLAGGMWVDTTNDPTSWDIKIYDGTTDITAFTLSLTGGTVSISSADTSFTINKFSADAVGPILSLVKRRIASGGQVLAGDIVGELRVTGRASDSSNPIVAKMKVVAIEDQTATENGIYIAWETSPENAVTAVEHMRLMNGFLGIGTSAPDAMVHAKGATGVKSEYVADSANAAKITLKKSRVAGSGATQSGDAIGELSHLTTDSASAVVESAKVQSVALENHTGSARGTKLVFSTTTTGATTTSSKLEVGDIIDMKVRNKVTSQELDSQDVATAATIAQLSATKILVEMTGSTATSIQGINSGSTLTKVLTIHNRSSATVTLEHEDAGATAADRLKLPGATDVALEADQSIDLFYDVTDTRWKLKSYNGSGFPIASQAEMETATAINRLVTPGRFHYHPGSLKAYVYFDASSGTPSVVESYNVSSITDSGVGLYVVNFTTSTSNAYIATASCNEPGGSGHFVCTRAPTTSSIGLSVFRYDNTLVDPNVVNLLCVGDM